MEINGIPISSLYADTVEKRPPEVRSCEDARFDYEAASPYYKASFKGGTVRINLACRWIELSLRKSLAVAGLAETRMAEELSISESSVSVSENLISISDLVISEN